MRWEGDQQSWHSGDTGGINHMPKQQGVSLIKHVTTDVNFRKRKKKKSAQSLELDGALKSKSRKASDAFSDFFFVLSWFWFL